MFKVTQAAREYLGTRLADSDRCFRIVTTADGEYTLEEGQPRADDLGVRHEGRVLLAVEPDVATRLHGWVLDVDASKDDEPQLLIVPAPPGFPGKAPPA